jgi:peptidyl-prolyl cis-trans isomerase SurA
VVQTRARHILVRTNELVSEADAQRRLAGLRERVTVGKVDFAELARLHSEDGTAARGGDLEWVYPGDTVPEFERAMNELKPGEVSQPVKTPFGWHLIEVLERRTGSLSTDRVRMQARVALKERKADEAYQEWLRQLRDRTYVELRLEDK